MISIIAQVCIAFALAVLLGDKISEHSSEFYFNPPIKRCIVMERNTMPPLVISCSFQLNIPPKESSSSRETLFADASLHLDEFVGFVAFDHPQGFPKQGS